MAQQRNQKAPEAKASEPNKCDNHPERNAALSTTSNGAHQELNFCNACIPPGWS